MVGVGAGEVREGHGRNLGHAHNGGGGMSVPEQQCAEHGTKLAVVPVSKRAPEGLWCHEGDHSPSGWRVMRGGREIARGTRRGVILPGVSKPVPAALSCWACSCARCGHAWYSEPCGCITIASVAETPIVIRHAKDCVPPPRCPACKATNWQRAA